MRRTRSFTALVVALLAPGLVAVAAEPAGPQTPPTAPRIPKVAVPPGGAIPDPAPSRQPIPRASLEQMYRFDLADMYRPELMDRILDAHRTLEAYFAAGSAEQRAEAVEALRKTGLDPNLLGRLCRIRLNWPELAPGVYYVNERMGPHPVMYFLGVPQGYDRGRPWPLVIALPGIHPFVTQPPPSADEVVRIYTTWIQNDLRAHPDALVLMPLINLSELWGPSLAGMNAAIQPLLHVAGRVNVDPRMVYMLGHAMCAHATWSLALHYPTYFAAINPMSPGELLPFQALRLNNLRNVLTVVWHDPADPNIPVAGSRQMVELARRQQCPVEYEESSGVDHTPTDAIAERLYQKMRARTRQLYPRELGLSSNRREAIFNRADWLQVFDLHDTGGERRYLMRVGSGVLTMYNDFYRVSASITAPNRFEITADNAAALRVLVNDQLVDFSKPVTVMVNRQLLFQGSVKPDLEEMLRDQLFLGRGWRYYTAVIDLDVPATRRAASQPARGGGVELPPNR